MDEQFSTSGKTVVQAAKEAFEAVRVNLPKSWLRDILAKKPELNAEPHLTRLKNIRLGRVAPKPEEAALFASMVKKKPMPDAA